MLLIPGSIQVHCGLPTRLVAFDNIEVVWGFLERSDTENVL